jgi:hypothetical protein
MPGILNYTTEIAVGKTLGEIGEMLRLHGASDVMTSYDDNRQPTLMQFVIKTQWGPRPFALPANVEGVYNVLLRQADARKIGQKYATREQAQRVAWRIVREWLAAQLAMIEAELVTLEQTMLPYLLVRPGQTLYKALDEGQLQLPQVNGGQLRLPGSTEE